MRINQASFISFLVLSSIAVSSCSMKNANNSMAIETGTPANSENSNPSTSENKKVNTSDSSKQSGNTAIKKTLQQLSQKSYFNGTCVNISSNSNIETQEFFNGGIINCGIINYITWNPQKDDTGHEFQMTAKILASDHQWKIGSISEVEGTKKGLSILIENEMDKKAKSEITSEFSTQIAVGTASTEGNNTLEKERGHNRAVSIRQFITKNYGTKPKYLLNLGKFQDKKCSDEYYHETKSTKYQRPIIIISINRQPGSSEPDKKYVEKITKKNLDSLGYGLSYRCYSDFDLVLF